MSIKTDQLPQNAAPQLTDTLLLADSAGGTAQLSLAQAAAFFGAEMVKAGNPVGAALSSKAALSAQEAVELTAVPSRTLELEASELPGFIAGLPRLLTKHLYIRVSGSLTANTLNFEGFYGSGSMQIVQVDKDAVFKTQAILNDCSVSMSFNDIRFQCPDSALKGDSYGICASHCSSVRIYGCTFSGGSTVNKDYYAFNSNVGSTMLAFNICAEHCAHVALASNGGILTVSGLDSVDALHDNETGAYVYHGGIITIFGHTPDTLGGNVNLKAGGIIVKEDGTLL